jgi:hypothetical protein
MLSSRLNRSIYATATRLFRHKRFAQFEALIAELPRPLKILDIGGTQAFWEGMDFVEQADIEIVLANLTGSAPRHAAFRVCSADGRRLPFASDSFDLVFSNSVIEHLGSRLGQEQMAAEVNRLGSNYYIQTPNRRFPIEPHYLLPLIHFLPRAWQARILLWLRIEYFDIRIDSLEKAYAVVDELVLLSAGEFHSLLPNGRLIKERFFGLTKSFTLIKRAEPK